MGYPLPSTNKKLLLKIIHDVLRKNIQDKHEIYI